MTTNNEQVLAMYSNPSLIQSKALDDLQARLTNGVPIVDGNNVCSFLLENMAANSADIVKSMINNMDPLYAKRAQTSEDLYRHMSDFDYLNLFSSPATTYIELIFRKDTIVNNAIDIGGSYNKVVIPKNSVFTIEQYTFGIYYPVEIRVNKNTDTIVVVYDTSETNPLQTLSQNTIEHRVHTVSGVEMLSLMIPVYQFTRTPVIEQISSNAAFVKTYDYTDKFYAIRAYTNNGENDTFVEVAQTLSDAVYDPDVATVRIMVDQEANTVKIAIPQTYLTSNMFGSQVKFEILTSKGSIDANVSAVSPDQITTRFTLTGDPEKDQYITPITRPDVLITRLVSSKISGGGDGLTFEELRNRVIHNSFYGSVILSPVDIINYLSDRGFDSRKYQDGITNRIYLCSKELRTSKNTIIPAANLVSEFDTNDLTSIATINNNADESFTIYPTTLLKYNKETGRSKPVSDTDVAAIDAMTVAEIVDEFNNYIYTTCPYHVRIDTNHRFPSAYVYDFNNPKVNSLEFIEENVNVATQMTCANIIIRHEKGGVGGFDIELFVVRSNDLVDTDPSNLKVVIAFTSYTGQTVYQEAVYDREESSMSVFTLKLTTDYDITSGQKFKITSLNGSSGPIGHYVSLRSDVRLAFFVSNTVLASPGSTSVANDLAGMFPTFIPVTEQLADITLCELKKELFTNVDIIYSELEYETYTETELLTYDSDVYARDVDGNIEYTVDGGTGDVTLTIEHVAGDTVYNRETVLLTDENVADYYESIVVADGQTLSESNKDSYINSVQELDVPIILHKVGDTKLDQYGNPIISKERDIIYYIDLLQVDRKLHYSTRSEHLEFYSELLDTLASNQSVIAELKPQLIEETWAYYVPLRSLGTATFKLDNLATTKIDLELSVKLKLYVQEHVISNQKLLRTLRDNVVNIVDNTVSSGIISIVEIADQIKEEAGGLITSVDVLGVNGDQTLQTLISVNDQVIPSLKTILTLNDAGEIITARDLELEFVEMDV